MTICDFFKNKYNGFTRTATLIATLPLMMYALAGCASSTEAQESIPGSGYRVAVDMWESRRINRSSAWSQTRKIKEMYGADVDEACARYDENENGIIELDEWDKMLEEKGLEAWWYDDGRIFLTRE
jgi:hypothetical protein